MSNILLIDENASHRQMVQFALQQTGDRIFEAVSGEQAMDLLACKELDLLIVGCNFISPACFEMLKSLFMLKREEQLPLIVMSRNPVSSQALPGLPVCYFAWLKKPFGLSEVQNAVAMALASTRIPQDADPGGQSEC